MAAASPDARDTIYALSSGAPPAGIAIIRISGPRADATLMALAGRLPAPRRASLATLESAKGDTLDRAIVLRFPGPASATGEDMVELHLHGGRAVIAAVSARLRGLGLREAEPGEFTRRALFAGRLDHAEVEALADLLAAETEVQRRDAIHRSEGAMGRLASDWGRRLTTLHAMIEAAIDHDEDAVGDEVAIAAELAACRRDLAAVLAAPPIERLRDGVRVVFTGPVNAGKSSLFNAILGSDAAIVSATAGTTRDAIERPVAIDGIPFLLIDTAGLRDTGDDIEREGIVRARRAAERADIVIDLGGVASDNPRAIAVTAKCDVVARRPGTIATSVANREGVTALIDAIVARAATLLPGPDEATLDVRRRRGLTEAADELRDADGSDNLLFVAEHVRRAASACHGLTGHRAAEAMLDTLFARFCLGK